MGGYESCTDVRRWHISLQWSPVWQAYLIYLAIARPFMIATAVEFYSFLFTVLLQGLPSESQISLTRNLVIRSWH